MTHSALFILALVLALPVDTLMAQSEPLKIRVKPDDMKNIARVELMSGDKTFPQSILYKTNRNSIVILPGLIEDDRGRPHFMQKEVQFEDVDYITIFDRKRKIRSSIIGGLVGGVATYFIADQLGDKQISQTNIELLGQSPQTRFVEPIALGFLGAGIGVIVGELLSPIRLSTEKLSKRELQQKLKQFSYR